MPHDTAIEPWISRCIELFFALYPHSPLDGTDWEDEACALWVRDHRRAPEDAVAWYDRQHATREWKADAT